MDLLCSWFSIGGSKLAVRFGLLEKELQPKVSMEEIVYIIFGCVH